MSLLDEVWGQPAALERSVDTVHAALSELKSVSARLGSGDIHRVILTGMGASYYALYPGLIYLIEHGINAMALDASELLHYYPSFLEDGHSLLVVISQSGESVEIRQFLDKVRNRTAVVGITNDPESSLAQHSDAILYIDAGEEFTIASKTYTCTLAALHLFARFLSQQPLEASISSLKRLADSIQTMLPEWQSQASDLAETLSDTDFLTFLGRGPSLSSALTGSLIVKETAKLPAAGMSAGQFRHGSIEATAHDVATFIFASPGRTRTLNLSLASDLTNLAGHVIVVGNADQPIPATHTIALPVVDMWTAPIVEIVPVQLFAAQLAIQRGIEPGKFRYIQKVITDE